MFEQVELLWYYTDHTHMTEAKSPLHQLLLQLAVEDRTTMLDALEEYPEMTDMVVQSFLMKQGGVAAEEVKEFEQACLKKIKQQYGKRTTSQ